MKFMNMEGVIIASCFNLLLAFASATKSNVFDVTKYGASPNSDVSKALTSAWKEACESVTPSTVLVPKGSYKLTKADFNGPCKSPITFQLRGTLVAASGVIFENNEGWVTFSYIDKFTLAGGGTFDGQGQTVWGRKCDQSSYCGKLPLNLVLNFVTNAVVKNIVSLNSKQFHIKVFAGKNVTLSRLSITAPGNSLNTDGIHLGRSEGIKITNSIIKTGDDCISMGDGSKNINITKVTCGPGHGISVGSLGKFKGEAPVEGVTVSQCTFRNTTNGIRIKTWPDSNEGLVSQMHYEDITMENVWNPIIIDQEYCPYNKCNKKAPSKIKIKDVRFRNITGTSATPIAVNLLCSSGFPCENVEVSDIDLKYHGNESSVTSQCKNVKPKFSGKQIPPACA